MLLKQSLSRCSAFIVAGFLLLSTGPVSAQNLENGEQLFQTLCARCHGMLGEGSEGPSLTRPNLVHAPDDAALVSLIVGGIPGTGMPGSRQLRGHGRSQPARHGTLARQARVFRHLPRDSHRRVRAFVGGG